MVRMLEKGGQSAHNMVSMLRKYAILDLKIQVPKKGKKRYTPQRWGLYILKFEFIGNYSSFNIICPC
jgi:hypothetical protein